MAGQKSPEGAMFSATYATSKECAWCGAPPGKPCVTHTGDVAGALHKNRGMPLSHKTLVQRAEAERARPATDESVATARRQFLVAALICVPIIVAEIVFYTLNSNFNDISNISCDPSERLSCTHVETPDINKMGDMMSFLLGAPALIAGILLYVFFRGWWVEARKIDAR